jgi:hypothetical protein
MKPTEAEARATLEGDPLPLLINTYNEYVDDEKAELPADSNIDRTTLVDLIIKMMITEGDIRVPVVNTIVKLSDIARELGVDPKVARDKIRKYVAQKKPVPKSLKMRGWVFEPQDKAAVIEIIRPRKSVQ